ncbi:hypothetical protein A3J90_02640 [candidate division WOR-1 bacterium RIFOXYC2_FULL_37_10]|uniref:Chorismate-utilising enzyme C-terminal domain-containing protein n=1 Tax=candidate division WOR-1 bacterium RIFOXYB2_FULL_37_13 TaxID=1802579 RepID=A0A1F4SHQ0_UNCSA|nr:MAG: hypothetical protein A2310_01210 [candidate division WOR-1 bacterium RIFOXYB2_FULL_37_13]OGC36609.1 MAG: hypothetical protein A3J90_02640 [candidate division WOR-1 bacterium RIFOXYC2_FULL_37_10]
MIILTEFEKNPLLFDNLQEIISCSNLSDVPSCFDKMEEALNSGYFLAGFLSYEAGYGFEEKLQDKKDYDFPLIHFGVYKKPSSKLPKPDNKENKKEKILQFRKNISKAEYFKDIETIRSYIAKGDVYQITYCLKSSFSFTGKPFSLYKQLLNDQPVPYPAYIETKDFKILSLSPELFIKKQGEKILTKPMKGTWPRENVFSSLFGGLRLKYDRKNRAENIMICDLLRNDLGRIGVNIKAPTLFEVARYKTLFQMTSTVTGKIDRNIPIFDIFKALHPSGSVTGAPKIRAMEIIRGLEREERKIYTGAIGYITPERDMFFNIPIRTLLIQGSKGELGIGGGIVWDSTPQGEYDECKWKSKFLTKSD